MELVEKSLSSIVSATADYNTTYNEFVANNDVNGLFIHLMTEVGESLNTHVLESNNGWDFKFFCKDTGKMLYHMDTFDTGMNSHLAFKRMRNKVSCVDFLLLNKVATVEHYDVPVDVFNSTEQYKQLQWHVESLLLDKGYLIIKPTSGGSGKDIYKVNSFSDFLRVIGELKYRGLEVCYCPFYSFDTEYRYVVLDGEVQLAFGKRKTPNMLQHNLSEGAKVVGVPVNLDSDLSALAVEASKAVQARFCTVDIINTPEGLKVLELNGSVTLKRVLFDDYCVFKTAKEIYREALILGSEAGSF